MKNVPPTFLRLNNMFRLTSVDQLSHYISIIQKCDNSKSGYLDGKEIENFYHLLTNREEIAVIYGEYAKTTGFMSPENLVDFLMKEQIEKASLADAHRIIEKYEPNENGQYLYLK